MTGIFKPSHKKNLKKVLSVISVFSLLLQLSSGLFYSPVFAQEVESTPTPVEQTTDNQSSEQSDDQAEETEETPSPSEPIQTQDQETDDQNQQPTPSQETSPSPTQQPEEQDPTESPTPTDPVPTITVEDGEKGSDNSQEKSGNQPPIEPEPDLEESPEAAQSAQPKPEVTTDKDDYEPGETVKITGQNFPPTTELKVKVTRPDKSVVKGDGSFEEGSDFVTTDEEGKFEYFYQLNGIEGEYQVEVFQGDTVLAATTFTDQEVENKIRLCHATSSPVNPYNLIEVDFNSVQFQGHDGHENDIIPPFPFGTGDLYPGKNWTQGNRLIWENDCNLCFQGTVKVNKEVDTDADGDYETGNTGANNLGFRWGLDHETPEREMGTQANVSFCQDHEITENTVEGYHYTGWYSKNNDSFCDCWDKDYSCQNPEGTDYPVPVKLFPCCSQGIEIVLCNQADETTPTPTSTPTSTPTITPTPGIPQYQCQKTIYAANNQSEFYWVDDSDGSLYSVSTLNFGSSASADHPNYPRTYYIERYGDSDRLGYYDHNTGTHHEVGSLNVDNFFAKLTFDANGNLYGLTDDHHFFEIDYNAPSAADRGVIDGVSVGGDITVDENNVMYLIGVEGDLFTVDVNTLNKTPVSNTGLNPVTGMAYLQNKLYLSVTGDQSAIWTINPDGTELEKLSTETTPRINDLSSCVVSVAECGNGIVEEGEDCDDGNNNDEDYCANSCQWNNVCLPGVNMLTNGGFETPEVDNPAKWDIYDSGYPYLDWSVEWREAWPGQPDPAHLELHRGVNGWLPDEGFQYAELDTDWEGPGGASGEPASVKIYRDLPTIDDYQYQIKFAYSPRPERSASDNSLKFEWGSEVYDLPGVAGGSQTSWIQKEYNFTASDSLTRLQFTDTGIANSFGVFLDDVSVECNLPQPECGNGIIEGDEECDGDAPRECELENGYAGTQTCVECQWSDCDPIEYCGDGVVNGPEECDGTDGVTEDENFCTYQCQLVPIYDGEHACPPGTVKSEEPVESITVGARDQDGEMVNLASGGQYLFEASGVFNPSGEPSGEFDPSGKQADAGYTSIDGWNTTRDNYGIWGQDPHLGAHALLADFGGGVGLVAWDDDQTFNSDHVYAKYYEPTQDNVQFVISDRYDHWFDTSWNDQTGMNDNAGELQLDVYECEQPSASISGYKWDDLNGDGVWDDEEPALNDWEICLAETENNIVAEQLVALIAIDNGISEPDCVLTGDGEWEDGYYEFTGLESGTYNLTETLQDDWVQTASPDSVELDIGEESTGNNFGNYYPGQVYGYKYYDTDDDGVWEDGDGEFGYPGWQVCLTGQGESEYAECIDTDDDGYFEFTGLEAGDYILSEQDLSGEGWTQSEPGGDGTYAVTVQSGTDERYDFGNAPPAGIELDKTHDHLDGASLGDTVTYTLTLTIGDRTLTGVKVYDVLPFGVDYQIGTSQVDGVDFEPTVTGPTLTWDLGTVVAGTTVIITYDAVIGTDLKPACFVNLAFAQGFGSETPMETAVVDACVPVGVTAPSTTNEIEGQVLGAATGEVLGAATGNPTLWLVLSFVLMAGGLLLRKLSRIKKVILALLVLTGLMMPGKVMAMTTVELADLPEYKATDDFPVYYTALETEQAPVEVRLYVRKEDGFDWRQAGEMKTDLSGSFDVKPEDLDGDGKYYFYAKADGETSDEVSTTVDRSAPAAPKDYKKERQASTIYKISWKTPEDDDYAYTRIFASTEKNFVAEDATKKADVGSGTDEEVSHVVTGLEENKEYYFVLQGFDKAGNASGLSGDTTGETIVEIPHGEQVTGEEAVEGEEMVVSEEAGEGVGEGVGQETDEEGQILGTEEEEASEPAEKQIVVKKGIFPSLKDTMIGFSAWLWVVLVLAVAGIIIYRFVGRSKK